jgi:glutamate synthase (NADPH/NADH) large chain
MTGGIAVILGGVGDNFGAGMTGGMAFVYDTTNHLDHAINPETVVYQRVETQHWQSQLKTLITEHAKETGSPLAENILLNWDLELHKFWQICPKEMVSRLEFPLSDTQGNKKTA